MNIKRIVLFCLIPLAVFACKKDEFDIVNLNGNKITILGHGGMGIGHTYPMNSFESIAYCLALGADGTEIDVEMTSDSVLVAFHDADLSESTTGSGAVYTNRWAEISEVRYKNTLFTGYRIITLDKLFTGLKNSHGKLFSFDCKNFDPDTSEYYRKTFCNALLKIIDKHQLQDQVIIELKREDILQTLLSLRPQMRIFFYDDFDHALALAKEYHLEGIVLSIDATSSDQVAIAHAANVKVAVINTTTNSKNIEAIKKNVDIIQTDNLKHLLKILR